MSDNPIVIISKQLIQDLQISPAECIRWAEEGFRLKDAADMPAKMGVVPQGNDFITTMPCLLPPDGEGRRFFGVKIVSRISGQTPALCSTVYLYDAARGQLLAVMDGDWITSMRTGAVAALAARLLQRTDADTYSLMGLGNVARAVAHCLIDDNRDRPIHFRLLRYKHQAETFAEEMLSCYPKFKNQEKDSAQLSEDRLPKQRGISFEIVDDAQTFVREAQVLFSCVTVATQPLFPHDDWFSPGLTLIPVHTRGFQNCDLFFDKVFGDDTSQISRFQYFSRFRQYDEIHHVLQGKNEGRSSNQERILSYNYGLGLHDIYFAAQIYRRIPQGNVPVFGLKFKV